MVGADALLLALCVAWPTTLLKTWTGNPVIWCVAALALVALGVLTAFVLYLRQFFEPMQDLSQFYNTFQAAGAALEKLAGVKMGLVPADRAAEVRRRLRDASSEARDAFHITETTFAVPKVVILATRGPR